jgi:hypothetical protein
VTEVGRDEGGSSGLLAEPGRGGVAERAGGDALFDRGALVRAADDRGEDRRLRGLALQVAADGASAEACRFRAEKRKLVCE